MGVEYLEGLEEGEILIRIYLFGEKYFNQREKDF